MSVSARSISAPEESRNSTSPTIETRPSRVALIGLTDALAARLEARLVAQGWPVRRLRQWRTDAVPAALIVAASGSPAALTAEVRRSTATPLLLLTSDDARERATALHMGADMCLSEGEAPVVIEAQALALLRRERLDLPAHDTLTVGHLRIDLMARVADVNGVELALSPREFDVLAFFARHAGRALRRHELLDAVWGPHFVGAPNTVDVHVAWLRQKIPAAACIRLTTLRGVGYRLDVID